MNSRRGRLFLIEGIATVIYGVAIWFILPDCMCCPYLPDRSFSLHSIANRTPVPETASWLTEKEKKFIQARLPANAPRANEENFSFREIVQSLKDIRLWLFMLIWATFTVGTNGVTFYQSTVIADLGFT